MTHIVGVSSTIEAITNVASVAGAVPLTQTHVLTASMLAAATILLHTHRHTNGKISVIADTGQTLK